MRRSDSPAQRAMWRLVVYIAPDGRCPVHEFLDSLRRTDSKSWLLFRERHVPALEVHGPPIGEPLWKSIDDGLYEIRWHSKNHGKPRIYCTVESDRRIVCYEGEVKRWGPFTHRKMCLARRKDFLSDDYDTEKRVALYEGRKKGKNNGLV